MKKLYTYSKKFLEAEYNAYVETKSVVSYICFLTTWFQKAMLNAEIPYIKDARNKKLFKKADVLAWIRENSQEINPTYNYTTTKPQSKKED